SIQISTNSIFYTSESNYLDYKQEFWYHDNQLWERWNLSIISAKNQKGYIQKKETNMKKFLFLIIIIAVLSFSNLTFAKYSGGTGEPCNPFQISNRNDILNLTVSPEDFNKCFIQVCDVNMNGIEMIPISNYANTFSGVYDGGSHIIRNVRINQPSGDYTSFFGYLNGNFNPKGQIRNLGLVDVNITGNWNVGSFAGLNFGGSISNCYSTGIVKGNSVVGGLVGYNSRDGRIDNCYSIVDVSGTSYVGGFAGMSYGSSIVNCYSAGKVNGPGGGFTGTSNGPSLFLECFWDIESSGKTISASGTGKAKEKMEDANTFLLAGWDFFGEKVNGTSNYWKMPTEGGYPVLTYSNGNSAPEPMGSGTENEPYIIKDANELGTIWYRPSSYYRLANNIDLTGVQWSLPIAQEFRGVFDGQGFHISKLSIDGEYYIGLFGQINSGGSIKNLGLEDCNLAIIDGQDYLIGALAGYYENGRITNCYSSGKINSKSGASGGLIGSNKGSEVFNCHSDVNISGSSTDVGGIIGFNTAGKIENCYSIGDIKGICSGGIVGYNDGNDIINCYSAGSVSGLRYEGGIAGYTNSTVRNCYSEALILGSVSYYWDSYTGGVVGYLAGGNIYNCHSTGTVDGYNHVGGLLGYNDGGIVRDCYSTSAVSGDNDTIGGLVGYNDIDGDISHCFATGQVSGMGYSGGLIGINYHGRISSCYSQGSAFGQGYVGGFCGYNDNGYIQNCYSIGDANSNYYTGGFCGYNDSGFIYKCYSTGKSGVNENYIGVFCPENYYGNIWSCYFPENAGINNGIGEALTNEKMRDIASFLEWDFSYVDGNPAEWFMATDGYPILTWQISSADIYTDGKNNLKDFSVFANYWMRDDCRNYNNHCQWADMNFDGYVDIDDLSEFLAYWLEEGIY
ncbi:MAG: GLUG motif-containing protein, partial [Phycisphaerales bacterium]